MAAADSKGSRQKQWRWCVHVRIRLMQVLQPCLACIDVCVLSCWDSLRSALDVMSINKLLAASSLLLLQQQLLSTCCPCMF
jgi:hypothetical protein